MRVVSNSGNFGGDAVIASAFNRAVTYGAHVINNSYATTVIIGHFQYARPVTSYSAGQYQTARPLMLQAMRDAVTANKIVVFAAGNHNIHLYGIGIQPGVEAGLPYLFPELKPLWIAVVAVNNSGNETVYTHRCGVAATWCIAAPGGGGSSTNGLWSDWATGVPCQPGTPTSSPGFCKISGTSMAAPQVSGAIAILLQMFPSLTPKEVVVRLFAAANKTGQYAITTTFGQGLLDLEKATRALGSFGIFTGLSLADAWYPLDGTRIDLGPAFGDGLRASLHGQSLAVFDSFDGATFYVNPDLLVFATAPATILADGLPAALWAKETETVPVSGGVMTLGFVDAAGSGDSRTVGEVRVALAPVEDLEVELSYGHDPVSSFGLSRQEGSSNSLELPAALGVPYLEFMRGGVGAVATRGSNIRIGTFLGRSEHGGVDGIGTVAEYSAKFSPRFNASFQLGALQERTTVLGSETYGAFESERGTMTKFAGVSGTISVSPRVDILGSSYAGITHPSAAEGSIFTGFSEIETRAASLGVVRRGAFTEKDRLGLIASQPLRVVRGTATMSLATGRDKSGSVSHETMEADLAPTGRELNFEAFYQVPLSDKTTMSSSVLLRSEPGHVAGAARDAVLIFRVHTAF